METLDKLVGKQLGPYLLEEKVGDGTFLTVFRGKHPDLPRNVAVKVLNDSMEQGRILRETTILCKVGDHPNITQIFDADFNNGNPYMVVEYCESSLCKELSDGKKIDWETSARYGMEVADALEHIHKKGVIHGDIKPSNILLHEGKAKLSDFNTKDHDPEVLLNSLLLSKKTDFITLVG